MSKLQRFVLLSVLLLAIPAAISAADFWYGADGAVTLDVDSSKVILMFDSEFGTNQQEQIMAAIGRIVTTLEDENAPAYFVVCSLSTGSGYYGFLDSVDNVTGIELVEPYYLSPSGWPMLVGNSICVAFDESLSSEEIADIAEADGLLVDRELIGLPNVYVLLNTPYSGSRCVEKANALHNLSSTRNAHPDFMASIVPNSYRLFDYYHQYQPHTKKVVGQFNQATVWDFADLDDDIVVALIDDGVVSHEDLPSARIVSGYDFGGHEPDYVHDSDPSPGDSAAHGMACAGIISAGHTTDSVAGLSSATGVISMDPYVHVLPVKIFNDEGNGQGVSISDLVDAIGYAWTEGADLLSNSWSFRNPDYPDDPSLTLAIQNAFYLGRGGRGCPVIFSSGNTEYWYPDPNGVGYPSRLDECFAVGAITLADSRWDYSRYGPELDMVAPSDDGYTVGVWSLDQMGALGWNPTYMSDCPPSGNDVGYDCHFGGTSAACPLVAGTAALLLAKDPALNAAAVYWILRNSAVKALDWGTLPDTPHVEYGYGRVDAFRAVLSISHTGDVNNDGGGPDIADLVYLVNYMFNGGPDIFPSVLMADFNCDGSGADIADLVRLQNFMFNGGPAPENPCFDFGD